MSRRRKKKDGKVTQALKNSPINYFSDLFIAAMVLLWIVTVLVMMVFAGYATVTQCDTSIWCYVQELVAVPLTAGGAIWMVKNSVQHAIAAKEGTTCKEDFPAVDGTEFEVERKFGSEIEGG